MSRFVQRFCGIIVPQSQLNIQTRLTVLLTPRHMIYAVGKSHFAPGEGFFILQMGMFHWRSFFRGRKVPYFLISETCLTAAVYTSSECLQDNI